MSDEFDVVTDPNVGSVGLTEAAARHQGLDVRVAHAVPPFPTLSEVWLKLTEAWLRPHPEP